MALVNMRDMLYHAYENNYAVGAFDLVSLDFLEAVIEAAESGRAPVILSIAEPHFSHFDFNLMMPAVEAAAKRASIPVAIQLDHGHSLESAIIAINKGCNSVMIDASDRDLRENVKATQAVVAMAHSCGIPVVGEVGYVAGSEGEGAEMHPGEISLTHPAEAKSYVEQTGVDFLAVSIGTVQGRVKGRAKLDFQRLKKLNEAVNIPLVIHGGSGLNDDQFRKLPTMGVVKINYYTALSDVAAKTMRLQARQNSSGSFTDLKKGVKEAISTEVNRCMKLWGCAGRAAEVLTQCEPWVMVEQLILHNVYSIEKHKISQMMEESKLLLSRIPGIREVNIREAINDGGKYQFCWTIGFANHLVIKNFSEHPDFISFKNKLFQSFACESIIINFKSSF